MSGKAERYARVHELVARASELGDDELDAYLASACAGDHELEAEVRELVAFARDESAGAAFGDAALEGHREALEGFVDKAEGWIPERIGEYTILRQIGVGGMGVVYEAEQSSPRRRVAIKLLHPTHATPERLRRFRREAELLGRLQHPGIAQIFAAGTYEAGSGLQPYIAMELVEGTDLVSHCERGRLDRRARMELLTRVADAVDFAHQRGVVHRDLKPDNILVTPDGQPRVLDFGIARVTEQSTVLSTMLTEEGQVVGTLAYMSPEQATGDTDAIDRRSDVYSLGVIAFELLGGCLPYRIRGVPVHEAIRIIQEDEPSSLGTLDGALQGDLDTIVAKALEKEPERRYPSAAELAADIRRHLQDLPIVARPASTFYQLQKFARRNRALVGGALAVLVVALAGMVVATGYAVEATERAAELARANYVAGLRNAQVAIERGEFVEAASVLERLPIEHRGWEFEYLTALLEPQLARWEAVPPVIAPPAFDSIAAELHAVVGVTEWSGSERRNSPPSRTALVTWEVSSGSLTRTRALDLIDASRYYAKLHGPTGRLARITSDGELVVEDLEGENGVVVASAPEGRDLIVFDWDGPGGQLLWCLTSPHEVFVWDGSTSRMVVDGAGLGRPDGMVLDAGFDPTGTRLALRNGGSDVWLVDVATGRADARAAPIDVVNRHAFSPDGSLLAVAYRNRLIELLDGRTLESLGILRGHTHAVMSLTWTADSSRLLSESLDGTLRLWDPDRLSAVEVRALKTVPTELSLDDASSGAARGHYSFLQITPDGDSVVVAGPRVEVYPLRSARVLGDHDSYVYQLAFSPDGRRLASSGFKEGPIRLWDLGQGAVERALPGPKLRDPWGNLAAAHVQFTSDGARLVAASEDETRSWDLATGAEVPVEANEDGRSRLLGALGATTLLDPEPGRGGFVDGAATGFAVSPDRRWVALTDGGDRVALHRVEGDLTRWEPTPFGEGNRDDLLAVLAPEPAGVLEGHVGEVFDVAFSPDGTRLATGGNDMTVRIWDAASFELLLALHGHEDYVKAVAFSPDGTLLASASGDRTVRLWDALPLAERRATGGPARDEP